VSTPAGAQRVNPAEVAFEKGCAALANNSYRRAERHFSESLELDPERHDAWQRRAFAKQCLGDRSGALKDYLRALKLHPRCAWCWHAMSDIHAENRRDKDARACLNKAIRARPTEPSFRYDLGVLHLRMGDSRKAVKVFESLRRSKGFGMLWRQGRGRAWALLGHFERALKDLDSCVKLRPDASETWAFRALARLKAGDSVGALKDWNRAGHLGKRSFPTLNAKMADRLLMG
jgi:tetratricopeptide (TPR) repeat protein